MNNTATLIAFAAGIVLLVGVAIWLPSCSPLDFSNLKYGFTFSEPEKKFAVATGSVNTRQGLPADEGEFLPERERLLNIARASNYLTSATKDYYNGSFDEALRRLERAKWYDPSNYGVFKLSGQIFFEKSRYRKAFNDWSRATQLANDDQSIIRDMDVLKRVIRYCRNEIGLLQRRINTDPADRISMARLKELEVRMAE